MTKLGPTKLYCYADETGQDTEGRIFIVAAIVAGNDRDYLLRVLRDNEQKSGKGKRKWFKAKNIAKKRDKYLDGLDRKNFGGKVFYRVFTSSGSYEDLMTLVIAQAINLYREKHEITDYKATIIIDGLRKKEQLRVGKSLRELGIKTRKIRGARDESDALIRLADTVAGLIREAEEGRSPYESIKLKLEKSGVIKQL